MKGLCPFHDEKTPSFNVNPARGFFHCFGCGEGGGVIDFLMKIDGLSFVETVERLAEKYGVELKREEGDVREERPKGPRARQADRGAPGRAGVLRRAAAHPRRGAGPAVPHRARLRRPAAETFGLGFAPRERRGAVQAPAGARLHARTRWSAAGSRSEPARRVAVRPVPGAAAVADPRGERRDDRVRGAADLRRRPDRGEVPQHLRDPDLQEEPGALRHRPGPPRDGPVVAGGGGRGLHRRDGLPPGRRRRPRWPRAARRSATSTPRCCAATWPTTRSSAARWSSPSTATRPGRRRRSRRSRATRTSCRRPTSPWSRTGSTRATCGSRRATPRCASWWRAGCRCTGSCSATSSPSTTSTAPTAGSTPARDARGWCRASATSRR